MDFEARLHRAAQHLIPQQGNSGYPPMVVYYHRFPAACVDEQGVPLLPLKPDPRLLEAAAKLGAWADFLVIPANFPHVFHKEIEQAAGKPLLSIIDATLSEVKRRQLKRVGVLGFGKPMIYLKPLRELGIAAETLSDDLIHQLDQQIAALVEGRTTPEGRTIAKEAVELLRLSQAQGIILGCTEIPLLLGNEATAPDLINPAQLLAEAAVKYALEGGN